MPLAERPESITAAAEAIADSLGFCDYHGSLLNRLPGKRVGIARALRDATECVVGWLSDETHYTERLFELFFAVEQSCVGCRLHDQRLTRVLRRASERGDSGLASSGLCFPHYRELAYDLKSQSLPSLADGELRLLRRVVEAIGSLADEEEAGAAFGDVSPATLRWALAVVAGEAAVLPQAAVAQARDSAKRIGPLAFRVEDGIRCTVCAEIVRAEQQWADSVKAVARFGKDLWTALPTCAAHIALCAELGDRDVALLSVRYAAALQKAALESGVVALERDNIAREAAKQSVFYRRKSPAYILGQQRKMITKIPGCPACERMVVAQERAVGAIVGKLVDAKRRNASTTPLGELCLKHFASVYAFVWKTEARTALLDAQIATLRALISRLAQSIDFGDPKAIDEGIGDAMHVWQTVVPEPPGHG